MVPALHTWYTLEEAIAAFPAKAKPRLVCDGQFAVLPQHVLCFFTLGDPATKPHASSPSEIVWKPERLNYAWFFDSYPWLPHAVRKVWDQSQTPSKRIKQHHILARLETDDRFFHAGPAHLSRLEGKLRGCPADHSAYFLLSQKLPRDTWLHLGGYPAWLVEVNHQVHRVDQGDLTSFRALTAAMPRQEFSHLRMTRYEEDSLTIHTNDRRGWLMYLREPGDGGDYTFDAQYAGDPLAMEEFRCGCGIELDFPARDTLPRDQALAAAEEFFVTGQMPQSVPRSA